MVCGVICFPFNDGQILLAFFTAQLSLCPTPNRVIAAPYRFGKSGASDVESILLIQFLSSAIVCAHNGIIRSFRPLP